MIPFDSYEISPCTRTEETDRPGHFYFEVCEPDEADVWTLYGHIPGEGVMAIGDFTTREGAEEAFQRITGIPFGSHEEVVARVRVMHAGERLLKALVALASTARTFRNVPQEEQAWTSLDDDSLNAASAAIAEATDNSTGRAALRTVAIKLTSPEAIRAACELSIAQGERHVQVMYKSDDFDDDDYVGADLEEFASVKDDPEELAGFCGGRRHSWELWTYEWPDAGEPRGGVTRKEAA